MGSSGEHDIYIYFVNFFGGGTVISPLIKTQLSHLQNTTSHIDLFTHILAAGCQWKTSLEFLKA